MPPTKEDGIDAAWIIFADTVVAAMPDKRLGPSDILIGNSAAGDHLRRKTII